MGLIFSWESDIEHLITGMMRVQFSSVQLLSHVWLFATPWIAARQASLFINNSQSLLKFMSVESVMPSSHLILCGPLLLLPPIPPSISVLSNESTLHMRWPKYWSFSFSISPSNEHPGLMSFRMDWLDLLALEVRNKFKGPDLMMRVRCTIEEKPWALSLFRGTSPNPEEPGRLPSWSDLSFEFWKWIGLGKCREART